MALLPPSSSLTGALNGRFAHTDPALTSKRHEERGSCKDEQAVESTAYYLPRNEGETERLERQHYLIKEAFFGHILHPTITLPSSGAAVLDSATGTGVFLRDLVFSFPDVTFSTLAGFDVSPLQFHSLAEPHSDLNGHSVLTNGQTKTPTSPQYNLFVHDVTQALPEEHIGKYDLVHQRLLGFALTKDGWDLSVKNLVAALKPGGWAQFFEFEPVFVEQDIPALNECTKIVDILEELGQKDFRMPSCGEERLKAAGFKNTATLAIPYPLGPAGERDHPNSPPSFGNENAANVLQVWNSFWAVIAKANWQDKMPEGARTEADFMRLVEAAAAEIYSKGAHIRAAMVIGQKAE